MTIDLDSILAIADGYAERMKIAREYFDRREPVPEEHKKYLATLADGEAVKAFEALRPLVWRIRNLERQTEFLASRLSDHSMNTISARTWLDLAEQAAEEAGE